MGDTAGPSRCGGGLGLVQHSVRLAWPEVGTFTIRGLPPGEYELSVLHESTMLEPTPAAATVKVGPSEKKQVDFTYQPKGAAK